jgi:glycosyl transferase family 87
MNRTRIVYPLLFAALHALLAVLAAPDVLMRRYSESDSSIQDYSNDPMELYDVRLFYRYATAVVHGKIPHRDFNLEYPIFAVPFFVLPRLVASDFNTFKLAFAGQMLIINALTLCLVARSVERRGGTRCVIPALTWYTLFFLLMARFVITRFDPLAMALCFSSSYWWFSNPSRSVLAGITAGVGALVKIVPALVALQAIIWENSAASKQRGRGTLAFVSVLAVGVTCWFAIGGRRSFDMFRFHLVRGVEVGSVYASGALLAGQVVGVPCSIENGYGCYNLGGTGAPLLARLATVVQLSVLGLILWRYRREGAVPAIPDMAHPFCSSDRGQGRQVDVPCVLHTDRRRVLVQVPRVPRREYGLPRRE